MSDPLTRKIYDPATKTLTYLIAYRSITLRPLTGTEGPWEGTQTVLPAENSIKENVRIEVHAEDVYIYAGSHFQFPGQHVTLTANRIFAVGDANKGSILFDCDGIAARPPEGDPTDQGASGQDAKEAWRTSYVEPWLFMIWQGESPAAGGQGLSGNAATSVGGDGGSFVSVGTMVNLTKKPITLLAHCSGKEGGMGQKGRQGGPGGKGWQYDKDEEMSAYEVSSDAIKGGTGGNGSAGGSGSGGGKAGVICTSLQPSSNAPETGFSFAATLSDVQAGKGGKGGPGGPSGDGGQHGFFWEYVTSKDNKSSFKQGKDGGSASVGGTGTPGSKGTGGCVLHFDSNDPGTLAGILNPAHLILIVNRLWLEYHTYFTAQIYPPPGSVNNKRVLRWHQSVEWVHRSLEAFGKSPPSLTTDNPTGAELIARVKANYADKARATSVGQARRMFFAMQRSKSKRVDYYGNSINTIETPDLSIDSLKTDIKNLIDIQNNLKGVQDLLDGNKKSRGDLQKAAGPVLKALQSYEADRAKLKESLEEQETVVKQANDDLRTSKSAAELAMDKVWQFIHGQFFCTELKDLLTVLSTVTGLGGLEFEVVVTLATKGITIADLYKGVDFSEIRKDLVTLDGVLIKAKF